MIDYNIVPEIEIERVRRTKPFVVTAATFTSVVQEILLEKIELANELDILKNELEDTKRELENSEAYLYERDANDAEIDSRDSTIESRDKEIADLEDELFGLRNGVAKYLANDPTIIETMQPYIGSCNLEELVDEHAD